MAASADRANPTPTESAERTSAPQPIAPRPPRRRRLRTWISLSFLAIIAIAIAVVVRTRYAAREIERTLRSEVRRQTGLILEYEHVGFAWRSLALRIEGIDVRHPTEGPLAHVDTVEIRPAFFSLFRKKPHIASISVDGGRLELRLRGNQLINGPTMPRQQSGGQPDTDLPFNDIAISDVSVHIEHDQLGRLDLGDIDVDIHKASTHRLLVGVLAQRGAIHGNACFSGPIGHVEARAEITDFRTLRVALAHIDAAPIAVHVREALVPLDLHGPLRIDADVSGPLGRFVCPVPHAPSFHGNVALTVRGTGDIDARRFDLTAHARGEHLQIDALQPDRTFSYLIAEHADVEINANQDRAVITRLRWEHSKGVATSPVAGHPPLVATHLLDGHPTVDGHFDVAGFSIEQMIHDMQLTYFGKVQWVVNASVDAHAELWRMADHPPENGRPAITMNVVADSHNFAVLKNYHQFGPQENILGIPHAAVTGQILVDSERAVFKNLVANFGHSHAEIAAITIRHQHSDTLPDLIIEHGHGENVHLEDLSPLAGIPMGGLGTFTVEGGGMFQNPVIHGEGHLRNFSYNNLPLGDYDTAFNAPYTFTAQDQRVVFPRVDARAGRSTFTVTNAFLDFHRYQLESGAHVESTNLYLADYYHMFKFENDPVFTPYDGQTMPRCRPGQNPRRVLHAHEIPCVDPSDPLRNDPRRPHAPPGTETGWISADASFVIGRPGDDPEGVLDVDLTARDLYVVAFDEPISNFDTHLRYSWLVKHLGVRGTRQFIEYGRGRYAGGTLEGSGSVDLGGQMHFVGSVHHVQLGDSTLTAGQNVNGFLDAAGTLEGTPESQRWSVDTDIHQLNAQGRNFGDVSARIRSQPLGRESNDPNARPPMPRWTMDATALGGALHINGAMDVPWRAGTWEDVDHHVHNGWDRRWSDAITTGTIELTRTLDLLPLMPARDAARFGADAFARVRAHIDLEHVILGSLQGDMRDVDARLVLDEFDLGAQGLRFSLEPHRALAACVHNGFYWVDPAASQSFAPCTTVPAHLQARRSTDRAPGPNDPVAPFVGPEGTRFTIAGGGAIAGRLGLGLHGEFDLARFASLLPGVNFARGNGVFDVAITGNRAHPQFAGALQVDHAAVGAAVLPNPVQDINLRVRLDGNDIVLDRANAQFGSSSIEMSGGTLHYTGREVDRADVPVIVRNLSLTPQTGVEVALDTDARISWNNGEQLPLVSGDVTITRARYTRPVNMSQDPSGNASVAGGESSEAPYDPRNDNMRLDLRVHAREPIRVTNNLMDGEIAIAESERPFRVLGTDQRVGVLGTLNVPRGRVFLRGADFEIRRGRVDFDNPERIQPNFDVNAQTEIRRGTDVARNQWRIDLHAWGTPDRFSLDMSSEPALSREDIALLLVFRMTRAELDQITSTGNVSAGSGLAVEALATATGLDRTVRQVVPIIDDFRIGSAYSPRAGGTVPQLSVGRRVNDRVRVGATVNTTDHSEVRATVDVRATDHTSVQLGWDNIYDQGGGSQIGNLGLDLRWRLEFE